MHMFFSWWSVGTNYANRVMRGEILATNFGYRREVIYTSMIAWKFLVVRKIL